MLKKSRMRDFIIENDKSLTFGVLEMSCASCVGRVEKALEAVLGVQDAHVNLASETATITVNETFKADSVTAALDNAGYPADLKTYRFSIENMSCASCVGRVERALIILPDVVSAVMSVRCW